MRMWWWYSYWRHKYLVFHVAKSTLKVLKTASNTECVNLGASGKFECHCRLSRLWCWGDWYLRWTVLLRLISVGVLVIGILWVYLIFSHITNVVLSWPMPEANSIITYICVEYVTRYLQYFSVQTIQTIETCTMGFRCQMQFFGNCNYRFARDAINRPKATLCITGAWLVGMPFWRSASSCLCDTPLTQLIRRARLVLGWYWDGIPSIHAYSAWPSLSG